MPNWFKKAAENLFTPIVKSAVESSLAKADRPDTTEMPTSMQIGYQYTGGGARRKYMGTIDFDSLRTFSVVYDVARACINYRKRQIENLDWNIIPKDDDVDAKDFQKQIDEVTAFFEAPAYMHDFRTFVGKILEDLLVLDAMVLWKDKTYGKQLKELLPVDGATIRIKVTPSGELPEPPETAFQQIIYGSLKGEYTTDEMYYKMMNPRSNTPYGLGPLECLIIGVDAALRSQLANAQLLSEGTVPEGFLAMPDSWTPDQIKDYQMWFDTLLAGNGMQSSRIKMIPGGKGIGYMPTKKQEDMRMLEFEKWLLLKTCALFDVPPSAIGFVENLPQNPGQEQNQLGNERGLVPTANFIKQFFTQIIATDFGYSNLKFEWKGLQVVDDEFELDRNVKMLQNGALTINEWRISQGMDPLEEEAADKPMIMAIGTPTLLESVGEEPAQDPNADPNTAPGAVDDTSGALEEMSKWERKAIKFVKEGKPVPTFVSRYIDKAARTLIEARLTTCKSKEDVRSAFKPFREDLIERSLVREVTKVKDKVSKFNRVRYEQTGSRA